MDLPTNAPAAVAVPVVPNRNTRPTRRPSGEPPPLPRHIRTTGVEWLVASVVLVGSTLAVFSRGLRGIAVDVTVVDDAVVRRLAELQVPGLTGTFRAVAALSSWSVLSFVPP